MGNSEQLKKFKLRLTTETPVSIGGDQAKALSPYADYVFSEGNDSLIYLNHEVIQEYFKDGNGNANRELIDRYVNGITTGMDNNRSTPLS